MSCNQALGTSVRLPEPFPPGVPGGDVSSTGLCLPSGWRRLTRSPWRQGQPARPAGLASQCGRVCLRPPRGCRALGSQARWAAGPGFYSSFARLRPVGSCCGTAPPAVQMGPAGHMPQPAELALSTPGGPPHHLSWTPALPGLPSPEPGPRRERAGLLRTGSCRRL